MEEEDATLDNCKRKAATTASIKIRKKHASCLKRVSSLLRRTNLSICTEEDNLFLKENSDLVDQFYKRKERRAVWRTRQTEHEDSPEELKSKCLQLAQAIHNAEFLVVYTGAGISTAASIPDYRGPDGIWTRLQKGQDIGDHDLSAAEPTVTHMALSNLYKKGIVRHVVSQNCDGLHLRSGLPKTAMSEVHGNMYIEVCKHCIPPREYVRYFDVTEKTSTFKHTTGRRCYRCGEPLIDTIVHFGERGRLRWPLNWQGACQAANACDTILCLGSSLKVLRKYPWLWQMDRPARRRPRLYIINLQWTPKDKDATLKINGKCDSVIKLVMDYLGFEISPYCKMEDPIFYLATHLHTEEETTTSRTKLEPISSSVKSEEEPSLKYDSICDNTNMSSCKYNVLCANTKEPAIDKFPELLHDFKDATEIKTEIKEETDPHVNSIGICASEFKAEIKTEIKDEKKDISPKDDLEEKPLKVYSLSPKREPSSSCKEDHDYFLSSEVVKSTPEKPLLLTDDDALTESPFSHSKDANSEDNNSDASLDLVNKSDFYGTGLCIRTENKSQDESSGDLNDYSSDEESNRHSVDSSGSADLLEDSNSLILFDDNVSLDITGLDFFTGGEAATARTPLKNCSDSCEEILPSDIKIEKSDSLESDKENEPVVEPLMSEISPENALHQNLTDISKDVNVSGDLSEDLNATKPIDISKQIVSLNDFSLYNSKKNGSKESVLVHTDVVDGVIRVAEVTCLDTPMASFKHNTSSDSEVDRNDLRSLWYQSFCKTSPLERSLTVTQANKEIDEDDIKNIWFWGFNNRLDTEENRETEMVGKHCEESTRRVTRSTSRSDIGSQSLKSEKGKTSCKCLCQNPTLCVAVATSTAAAPSEESLPAEPSVMRARDALRRKRAFNYKKYEAVFEVQLESFIYERKRTRRAKKDIYEDDPEGAEDDEDGIEENNEREEKETEIVKDKEKKKIVPGWYGKGYRKLYKKKKS